MKQIEQRLREEIGLDTAIIGERLLARTVLLRLKHLHLESTAEYRRLLAASPSEWRDLVEAVLVTESWFFREREAISTLVRLVLGQWLPTRGQEAVRILSLPCAAGEEPYSLAIALREAGVPSSGFLIDAVDLSSRAIATARGGLYRKNAFRGRDLDFRARHFRSAEAGFALNPAVCRSVHFEHGNLLSEGFAAGRQPYNFIFCRNLLIHFDRAAQQRAAGQLHRLLALDGFLFVSPPELPVLLRHGFVSAGVPDSFVCQKPNAPRVRIGPPRAAHSHPAAGASSTLAAPDPAGCRPDAGKRAGPAGSSLEQAWCLADAGRLSEAKALCEAYLSHDSDCASGHYLLGLLREAYGDGTAADCYRKALYLEPNHYESLVHLALLAQKSGDEVGARAFKRRAERVKAEAA